jgi:hypothetical protein
MSCVQSPRGSHRKSSLVTDFLHLIGKVFQAFQVNVPELVASGELVCAVVEVVIQFVSRTIYGLRVVSALSHLPFWRMHTLISW